VLALAGLAVLIGLGSWQMSRKAWKEALLSRIAERVKADPVPLSEALRRWHATGDVEYLHVRLTGHFLHAGERHVFAVDDRLGPGFHVYTPLETAERQLALVNRGFVPAALKEPSRRSAGQVAGEAIVTGLARRPMPRGWFVPASEPERNMFYWPDYPTMLASARDAGKGELTPLPFLVDADAEPTNPGG
jgi:surfeit locus 1 family protein